MPIIYEVADKVRHCLTPHWAQITAFHPQLTSVLDREAEVHKTNTGETVLDMSEWMSRVALETVGQTILGYSFDPLDSPHNNAYTSAVKELM
jgi:hypothetical protein